MEQQREPAYLTTKEAADYIRRELGIEKVPGSSKRTLNDRFISELCNQDKFPNAEKVSNRWQIPVEEVDAWIGENRLTSPTIWQRVWKFSRSKVAIIIYFLVGLFAFTDSFFGTIEGVERRIFTPTPAAVSLATPTITPTATPVSTATPTPILFSPAVKNETLILIADILIEPCIEDPACPDDPNNVTQRFIDSIREKLVDHPHIRVERLHQYIYEEGGSELAMEIGKRPEHNAAFVMWGNYVLEPDAEVYIFFDIMESTLPVFGNSYDERYGPSHIQPTMFDFKADLGTHWGQLTAFAAALTLFQDSDHKNAVPLFDTAAQGIDSPFFQDMKRALHFYRGSNYLSLGRNLEAKANLIALQSEAQMQITDDLTIPILNRLGKLYYALGETEEVLDYYNQALQFRIKVNDEFSQAAVLKNIGLVYNAFGKKEEVLDHLNQALKLKIEVGDNSGQATILNYIGVVHDDLGEKEEALDYYNQALSLNIKDDDKSGQAVTLTRIGMNYSSQGNREKALDYFNQVLSLAIKDDNKFGQAATFSNMSVTYSRLGDKEKALDYQHQALTLLQEIGDKSAQIRTIYGIGANHVNQGNPQEALGYFSQTLQLAIEIGDKSEQAGSLNNIGFAYESLDEKEKALDYYNLALSIHIKVGNTRSERRVRGNITHLYISRSEFHKAEEQMAIIVRISEAVGHPKLEQDRRELGIIQAVIAGQ